MKRIAWIFALAAAACAPSPDAILQPGDTRILGQDWKLARSGSHETFTASVPSTVAGTLEQAGFFGEGLLEGMRYAEADKTVFDEPWIYKTTFEISPADGRTELVFDGLGYRADIFLNGRQIASADTTFGPFLRRSFDVTSLLKRRNTLAVRVQRAQKGDLNIGFVDWNPRPLDESMGLIRPVTLHRTGPVSLEDVFVIPDLDTQSLSQADLEVRLTLKNHEDQPFEGSVILEIPEEGSARIPVTLEAGQTRILTLTPQQAALLHIDHPRVWWTHDLGTPELYTLSARVESEDGLSDRRDVTFGIRKIESRLTEKNYRQFTLNGKDILLKGAGWTDDIFLRDTPESIERQVRYVMDMHLNTIRFENIWGKDDTVYDCCDRLGVLAIAGFSCQWEWEAYCGLPEKNGYGCINDPQTEAIAAGYFRDQVIRLHNHACLAGWLTGSDCIPNPELEAKYLEIYRGQDYRPYINSAQNRRSSLSGWSGAKMQGPYDYVASNYWYQDRRAGGAYGWNTETGIGANLPQLGSLRRMIPEERLWPLSEDWDFHCTASGAMNKIRVLQQTVSGLYGGSDSLEDFVRKAHAVDYDGTRAMFEAFRVRLPQTTGIIQWMLNSAWPSLYWQLYDWYGVPTAGYYGARKGCEPRQLLFDYEDRKVWAVNESPDETPFEMVATVKVFDGNSRLIHQERKTIRAAYREVVPVFDLGRFDGQPHFVALILETPDGNPVADNFYALPAQDCELQWDRTNWYTTPILSYADLGFVFNQGTCDIRMEVSGKRVTLTNGSDVIAPINILQALDAEGKLVVPARWSDNFFPLLPGQSKTVTCEAEADGLRFQLMQ